VDAAHGMGFTVLMDLVHSHAVKNEVEGLSRFDGTPFLYFHDGERGDHPAWDSRCFNYENPHVLHFLLSNCRFWMDEYRFDGFRFDGVTSMLYTHHGLGKAFTVYDDYFGDDVDESALVYLTLANRVVHSLSESAVTIAEDVSGMPGLAVPCEDGGAGFDYRFAMGVPDYWIRLTKETPDEYWSMGHLWHELTNRRADERTISYAESHDQALVGDQTLIFRLVGSRIYTHMSVMTEDIAVSRGIALHKMIRLATLATAGHGYLNFMGNEFGHPEWVDFPSERNHFSFRYARRQWSLKYDPDLLYHALYLFDREMIRLAAGTDLFASHRPVLYYIHEDHKILAFERPPLFFVFNFHPSRSFFDYRVDGPAGRYQLILDTDQSRFGGHDRVAPDQEFFTVSEGPSCPDRHRLSLYLPSRTALVLEKKP
jgi:1,4-alpha-glucan branching enzyme